MLQNFPRYVAAKTQMLYHVEMEVFVQRTVTSAKVFVL